MFRKIIFIKILLCLVFLHSSLEASYCCCCGRKEPVHPAGPTTAEGAAAPSMAAVVPTGRWVVEATPGESPEEQGRGDFVVEEDGEPWTCTGFCTGPRCTTATRTFKTLVVLGSAGTMIAFGPASPVFYIAGTFISGAVGHTSWEIYKIRENTPYSVEPSSCDGACNTLLGLVGFSSFVSGLICTGSAILYFTGVYS